ncbi:FtsK/SpoIIIE domain-containing protein [Kitasatospora fiedleri]|uniref:FtsK/SpoIIIE domain-containing protein n=1 Tax=Kitasatospora fiedleri TaxID=2991545 RepID=UPI00249BFA98|nr:FtsK/SpoIIIE domain-containing protein [Kitasatospora fiedleri]
MSTDTRLPAPADIEVLEGEFVDDDTATSTSAADPGPARRSIATFLSETARREWAYARQGGRVLRSERSAWFNSSLLSDEHVRADWLNTRYAEWQEEQKQAVEKFTAKVDELEKLAGERAAEGTGEDSTPKDHAAAQKAAETLRAEAATWREYVRGLEQQPYTGHREPTAAELAAHRRRMSNRRRWRAIACGVATGAAIVQFGSPVLLLGLSGGLLALSWAKGRISGWRSGPPEVQALDYPAPPSAARPAGPGPAAATAPGTATGPVFTKPAAPTAPTDAGFTATWTPAAEYAAPAGPEGGLDCEETALLTEAMLAAGAISDGVVRLAAPVSITRMSGGWMAHVVLPKGEGVTAETVLPKLGQIAGEMGLDRARFFLDPVHASAGGNAKTVAVAAFTTDPFTEARLSPLPEMDTVDVWADGIPVAYDAYGALVNLILKDTSLTIGGASRSGKGAAIRSIAAGGLLDLRVNLRVIDGKAPGQDRWRNLAASFVDETGSRGAKRAKVLLEALVDDMGRRAEILQRYGMEQIDDPKLISELGGLELVIVDEVAALTGDKKHGNAIKNALAALSARGLAFGIILVLATQVISKGADGVLPRLVTGNISWKWAMRVTDVTESNMALAPGAARAGWDASSLDPAIRGMGILLSDRYRRVRGLWLDGADMTRMIDKLLRLRHAAGRLRGQWADPIEAAMRRLGVGTPLPNYGQSPQPAEPDDPFGEDGDDLEVDVEDDEDGVYCSDDDEDDDQGVEFTPDGIPILLLRAYNEIQKAGGRMHTGPLAELLGYEPRELGLAVNGYLRDVGVERPGGGQLRVPGVERPGLGYYAETLKTAINRYQEQHRA